ncbi:hypothetical protein C0966_17555 (plasmid) [Bacillus methanolicus]|uniref:hypothetical protein n=1 Tax=Bacillus methanolicus TaxID=1471 RepID=UPI0023805D55|nr:hypothetical protein [Bacillus methanolicus]MDE3841070.1 hypothetical protein [Bacillus methanolicus]
MKEKFWKFNKNIRFGRYNIRVTTYYLWKHKSGLRIEVRRFTRTQTVEIQLLIGDDKLTLKRVYQTRALKNATIREVDAIVEEFIQYAKDKGFLLEEQRGDINA